MSKYNNIESIPIDSIPKEDIAQAMHEWAEGDDAMERLLWSCYNNGIKTNGCHAGSKPYLGLDYEEQNKDKLSSLMDSVLEVKGSQVLMSPDGGNPFSGDDWYKPYITMGFDTEFKGEADQLFDMMSESIINNGNTTNYASAIELFSFLIDRYSGINIRIAHSNNDEYVLTIEKKMSELEMTNFGDINDFFISNGLFHIDNNIPRENWAMKANNKDEFISKINDISSRIISNYSFKKPDKIDEAANINIAAHIKRDECIRNGEESKFDLWLMDEQKKYYEAWDKVHQGSKTQEQKQIEIK